MYDFVSLDVLYLYLLIDSAVKTKSEASIKNVVNFFKLLSVSDILRYSNSVNILTNTLNLRELRKFILNNSSNHDVLINNFSKVDIVIYNFLKSFIQNIEKETITNEIEQLKDILIKYEENEFVQFLKSCIIYISDGIRNNPQNTGLLLLYCSLKEYMDYNTYEKDKSGCHTDINL